MEKLSFGENNKLGILEYLVFAISLMYLPVLGPSSQAWAALHLLSSPEYLTVHSPASHVESWSQWSFVMLVGEINFHSGGQRRRMTSHTFCSGSQDSINIQTDYSSSYSHLLGRFIAASGKNIIIRNILVCHLVIEIMFAPAIRWCQDCRCKRSPSLPHWEYFHLILISLVPQHSAAPPSYYGIKHTSTSY